jgi:uncharacterized protein YgiM (DUF1202 family)
MRTLVVALPCFLFLMTSPASGERNFPYKANVTSEDVYARSGPGQSYYPTDKLKKGQEVEVYRHDPGGWCAIRPVDGSFAWVSGRYLKSTGKDLAVVTEENVSARVGSRFSDVRDVIQVRLHKGETVEVLESPKSGGRGNESVWYKIAPPSGEFRWISSKYLDADYTVDGTRNTRSRQRDSDGRGEGGRDRQRVGESLEERSAQSKAMTSEEFQAELKRIELDLSIMVIDDPTTWSFYELKERTNTLIDQAQTAVERGNARLMAGKIAKFDDIKRRQEAVLAMRDRTDRSSRLWAKLRPGELENEAKSTSKFEMDGRYDGTGQLTQVVSPKPGAPRYALMDESGSVRYYITPAPGVNLQNYVGRDVGITGTRGYMPEQRASHITARHITPLEGQTVLR